MNLARCGPFGSPSLNKLAILRKLDYAVVTRFAVAIGDKDRSIQCDDHIRRLVEGVGPVPSHPGFTECHQHLSIRAELENLMAFSVPALRVRDPQITFGIHGGAMREDEQSLAKTP